MDLAFWGRFEPSKTVDHVGEHPCLSQKLGMIRRGLKRSQ